MIKFGDVKTSPILSVKIEQRPSLTEELEKNHIASQMLLPVVSVVISSIIVKDTQAIINCLVNFYSVEGQK